MEPDQHAISNSYIPPLSNDLALLILARVPPLEHSNLGFVNKHYLDMLVSGELYRIRKEIGVEEPLVFFLSSGESYWWVIDPRTGVCKILPILPSDLCFQASDKESLSVGSHLLVSGRELEGMVIWRYELAMDRWFKGPSMINPRCLFASANDGDLAYVAGGVLNGVPKVSNLVETYDPDSKSWKPMPGMTRCRKLCSGCFMDGRFYVIGGIDERGEDLICGEFFDAENNTWVLVPDMIKGAPSAHSRSPPLIAVAKNELYAIDSVTNQVKVHLKESNSWKVMGDAPVKADHSLGWGVAFKSMGDGLIVIGGAEYSDHTGQARMMVFSCNPDPCANGDLQWHRVGINSRFPSAFIYNCAVMVT